MAVQYSPAVQQQLDADAHRGIDVQKEMLMELFVKQID